MQYTVWGTFYCAQRMDAIEVKIFNNLSTFRRRKKKILQM